jgi:hypothetical protein
VIETKDGDLSRLLSINGRPLTKQEERNEDQRIQQLTKHPAEQRKLQQARNDDGDEAKRLLKILPDAMLFVYAERNGELQKLGFRPNPNFKPSSREADVFHQMEGEIWVNTTHFRLVEITGHLTNEVKFGGGLLGHLEKGGRFQVRQAEVAPDHWEITVLHVDMRGRVLFSKPSGYNRMNTGVISIPSLTT